MRFKKISYQNLNSRQKENYNYSKLSALLADYGFFCLRLTDDWNGADLIAVPVKGDALKVQLKARMTFQKSYIGKNLYIAFPYKQDWYIYPHDEVLDVCREEGLPFLKNNAWRAGKASWPRPPDKNLQIIQNYKISQN